jgi:hypothetical protein
VKHWREQDGIAMGRRGTGSCLKTLPRRIMCHQNLRMLKANLDEQANNQQLAQDLKAG